MSINAEKSCTMVFKLKQNKSDTNLKLHINNKELVQVNSFKYLGLELDTNMKWDNQYNTVISKMNQRVRLIYRYKQCLSAQWLQVITYGIILSVLDYCFPIWGNLSTVKYERIDKVLLTIQLSLRGGWEWETDTHSVSRRSQLKLFDEF